MTAFEFHVTALAEPGGIATSTAEAERHARLHCESKGGHLVRMEPLPSDQPTVYQWRGYGETE